MTEPIPGFPDMNVGPFRQLGFLYREMYDSFIAADFSEYDSFELLRAYILSNGRPRGD